MVCAGLRLMPQASSSDMKGCYICATITNCGYVDYISSDSNLTVYMEAK